MADPLVDIYTELLGLTAGSITLGATNFRRGFRREPDSGQVDELQVYFRDMGVGNITPYMGGQAADDLSRSFIVFEVASNRQGYKAGRDVAQALIGLLHKRVVTGYVAWLSMNSAPSQREDDEGRPIFSFTLRCEWKENRSA